MLSRFARGIYIAQFLTWFTASEDFFVIKTAASTSTPPAMTIG
jgi:hypothetical protein